MTSSLLAAPMLATASGDPGPLSAGDHGWLGSEAAGRAVPCELVWLPMRGSLWVEALEGAECRESAGPGDAGRTGAGAGVAVTGTARTGGDTRGAASAAVFRSSSRWGRVRRTAARTAELHRACRSAPAVKCRGRQQGESGKFDCK